VRVKQILLNLLSNAVKFSKRGGFVHLTVAFESEAASPLKRESIRLEIADSGIGIPSNELERIFDEFYQVAGRNQKGGTGLGLSLTKNFVEMHGGTMRVRSEVGRGSTFTVHLPRTVALDPDRRPLSPQSGERISVRGSA
jgi:signal transduction histidine kinase